MCFLRAPRALGAVAKTCLECKTKKYKPDLLFPPFFFQDTASARRACRNVRPLPLSYHALFHSGHSFCKTCLAKCTAHVCPLPLSYHALSYRALEDLLVEMYGPCLPLAP